MDNTNSQKKVLISAAAGIGLENMDIMFLSFTMTSIIAAFNVTGTQAGWIGTITNFGMLFGGIIFGLLADKIGRVKVFSATVVIFSVASALMFFASNIYLVYLFRFIAGIGAGGEYGACMSLVSESTPKEKLGKATSIVAIGGQIGAILAAVLASIIIPIMGWKMLYVIGILPVLMVLWIRKDIKEPESFTTSDSANRGHIGLLFKNGKTAWQTIGLSLMVMVQIAGYFGLMNWLPKIMQVKLDIDVAGSSLWMVSTILGMSVGMMTFGTVMDKLGAKFSYAVFLVCSAASVYLLTLANNTATLIAAAVVVGYFINGMYGGYGAIISSLYPTEIRATANNFIMNVGRAVGGFSSVIIGFLLDQYNSVMIVVVFLSLLYIFSLLIMLTIPGVAGLKNRNAVKRS
ncbi:MFS transporter [Lactococcus hodotermopsidis]|uniref:MFS transporter n=1 Tax=Pseudolactococcus hodotermopsidis TaxID=2709157 RepID=A0A6A0BD86_9LACT|nr:MFS transporter [Lactococcus hodotermopsidis]GFH43372.1 MFS transporter [Lactococcus hodotermopsidis]